MFDGHLLLVSGDVRRYPWASRVCRLAWLFSFWNCDAKAR
jgi:hypothetical protein